MFRTWIRTVFVAAVALAPLGADAQSYRCVGKDGKKYYGQTIPAQCAGVQVEQLSNQGVVVRRIEAAATDEQRAQKAAEEKAQKEREAQAKEDARRNRALLATYTSEKDIEAARARALSENEKALQEIEQRIAEIKKRQTALANEMEFYKGRNKPPAKLEQDVKSAENDYKLQQELLAGRKKEVEAINARYDADKRRFDEVTKGAAPAPAAAAAPSKK